jgi:hypothetical protein
MCVLLYIVTLGIYEYYWAYRVHRELPSRIGTDFRPATVVIGLAARDVMFYLSLASVIGIAVGHDWLDKKMGLFVSMVAAGPAMLAVLLITMFLAWSWGMVWQSIVYAKFSDRLNQLSASRGYPAPPVSRGMGVAGSILNGCGPLFYWVPWLVGAVLRAFWWFSAQESIRTLSAPLPVAGPDATAHGSGYGPHPPVPMPSMHQPMRFSADR